MELSVLSEDPNDFCYIDTETRAREDLTDPRWGDVRLSGAHRYSHAAKVVLLTYAVGLDEPVRDWQLEDFSKTLSWVDAPDDLLQFMARALKGEAWFVMWNSGFDRNVCNHSMLRPSRAEVMPVKTVIDAMAQGVAANLPAGLGDAGRALGIAQEKIAEGTVLIKLFATAGGGTPQSHPEEWKRYVKYGIRDTELLRQIHTSVRPLWRFEWEEFWASEAVNDRGLPIDRPLVENAAALAGEYAAQVNERVDECTHGECYSVNQHVALAKWVRDRVAHLPEAADILVKAYEEDNEGAMVATKVSLERRRIERLIAYLDRLDEEQGLTDDEYDVYQLLETKLFGASATPKKFPKMIPMLGRDNRLRGQYVFNGAQQTGRFSARGVQTHNMTRATVDDEVGAIEFINDLEVSA